MNSVRLEPITLITWDHPLKKILDQLRVASIGDRFCISDLPPEYRNVEKIKETLERETGRFLTVDDMDDDKSFVVTNFGFDPQTRASVVWKCPVKG